MTAAPKPKLSASLIIEAGLALAAQPGVTSISVRDLGSHLGIDPSAIYRHFRNKDELMRALLDQLGQRAFAAVQSPPESWREQLRELAQATLDEYTRHPSIAVEAVSITTHGLGEAQCVELMLEAFERGGLTGDALVQHYAMLASHILFVGAGIARGLGNDPAQPSESTTWFDRKPAVDHRLFPLFNHFGTQVASLNNHRLFQLGVDSIIESAERHRSAA